jgi:hypothetical protein
MFCYKCGKQIEDGSRYCNYCGATLAHGGMATQPTPVPQRPVFYPPLPSSQNIIIQQPPPSGNPAPTNAMGLTGFIMSLCAIVFCWTLGVGVLLWLLGLIFSLVGLQREPKGLARAGVIISIVVAALALVLILIVISIFGSIAGWLENMEY